MEKISVANLVGFRRADTPSKKKTIVNNLKKPKMPSKGGGDYWISPLSAISKAFRYNNNQIILDKIEELQGKKPLAPTKQTKDMYQKSIDTLNGFIDFNMDSLRPVPKLEFIKNGERIVEIDNIPIQVKPQLVFIFDHGKVKKIGAIWFIAKKGGFKKEEVGLFSESLFNNLEFHFLKDYEVDPEYCHSIDVISQISINYEQILSGEVTSVLVPTLDSLKTFL